MNETMVTMSGWVVGEVTTRRTANDATWARFRIVVKERRYDAEQQEWVDGHVMFVSVHCWRRAGDNVVEQLKRGHPVVVHGRLRQWGDEERPELQVEASSIGIDLARYSDSAPQLAAVA